MLAIYTDGSSNNKARDGGWGWVAIERQPGACEQSRWDHNMVTGDRIVSQGSGKALTDATSNRMELAAIYHALTWLHSHVVSGAMGEGQGHVSVWADSSYAKDCLQSHAPKWIARGWVTSLGNPVANRTTIEYILKRRNMLTRAGITMTVKHVPGHRYYWNNYVDRLAHDARIS